MITFQYPDIHVTDPPSTGFVLIAERDEDRPMIAELRDLSLALRCPPENHSDSSANGRVSIAQISDFVAELIHMGKQVEADDLMMKAFKTTSPDEERLAWGFYVRFYWW